MFGWVLVCQLSIREIVCCEKIHLQFHHDWILLSFFMTCSRSLFDAQGLVIGLEQKLELQKIWKFWCGENVDGIKINVKHPIYKQNLHLLQKHGYWTLWRESSHVMQSFIIEAHCCVLTWVLPTRSANEMPARPASHISSCASHVPESRWRFKRFNLIFIRS